MKKWIIGIIIILIIAVGGGYLYISRPSSAVASVNSFITSINKYNLAGAESYTNESGDITQLFKQIQGSDSIREQAMKEWFKAVKITINSSRRTAGGAVVDATIYSPNGTTIANNYQYNVNSLNITNQTVQDSNLNGDFLENQLSTAFLNAVSGNMQNLVGTNVQIKLKRSAGNWVIENDDEVIKGVLGGINSNVIFS